MKNWTVLGCFIMAKRTVILPQLRAGVVDHDAKWHKHDCAFTMVKTL